MSIAVSARAAIAGATPVQRSVGPGVAALLVFLCLLLGLNQVAMKVGTAGISPVLLAGLRSIGSCTLLTVWCVARGVPLLRRDGTLGLGLAIGLIFTLEFLLVFIGISYTHVSRAVLFFFSMPVFTALLAHRFVPGDRLTAAKIGGLAAALLGLAIVFADGFGSVTPRALLGDLFCLSAAVLWAVLTVIVKASALQHIPGEKTLLYQLVVSALLLPLLSSALGEPGFVDPTPLVWASLAYQSVVIAFGVFATWFWLMRRHPASQLASFMFLTPIFGVLAGGLLLDEPLGPLLLLGMGLVAFGIWLVNRPARRGLPSRVRPA